MSRTHHPRTLFTVAPAAEAKLAPDQRDALKAWREAITLRLRREFPDYTELGSVLFVIALIERGGALLLETISQRAACPEDRDGRGNVRIVRELKEHGLIEVAGYGKSLIGNNGLRNLWAMTSREKALAYLRSRCEWVLAELGIDEPQRASA